MKVVLYHRELVKHCFRHSVSSSALVTMIVTDANHEFLVMTARLTGAGFETSFCTLWVKSQPRALSSLKSRRISEFSHVPHMSQLSCHIADTATPQGQAQAVIGPWEVPVYKDGWLRPQVVLCLKGGRALGYAFIYEMAEPCSMTVSGVWQDPGVWHGSGRCPGPVRYGINEFWALTSSDHDKVQTLFLSGFHRTPNALGKTSLVFRLDLSVSWICGQDGWTNLEGKRVRPDLE